MATTRRLNPDSAAGNARITAPKAKPKAPAITKIAASSSYLQGEQAAARQLGTAGLAARAAQLPTAARATARGMLREFTGIDVSRKGVKVDPLNLAMALPLGKVIRAAKALKAVGKIAESEALAARVAAKSLGGSRKALQATREARTLYWPASKDLQYMGRGTSGRAVRGISEKVFPRLPKRGPMGQPDLGDLGAGSVGLPFNTPAQIRRSNMARRATQAADRVYELEKRLNLPGTAPKRGR